jgi:hypothetical protein
MEPDQNPITVTIEEDTTSFPTTTCNSAPSNHVNPIIHHEYHESTPSVKSWFKNTIGNPKKGIQNYFLSFFPFLTWIYRYNLIWFWGDLIAGVTVGAVVIPQSMAYAGLAKLAPQFGLYSSFMGVMIYWFFATSKVRTNKSNMSINMVY